MRGGKRMIDLLTAQERLKLLQELNSILEKYGLVVGAYQDNGKFFIVSFMKR